MKSLSLMNYVLILQFVFIMSGSLFSNSVKADDNWFCTEAASIRRGSVYDVCGIGESEKSEAEARSQAFENAKKEFEQICSSSDDCKDHPVTVDPKRTQCKPKGNGYICHRMITFQIKELSKENQIKSKEVKKFDPTKDVHFLVQNDQNKHLTGPRFYIHLFGADVLLNGAFGMNARLTAEAWLKEKGFQLSNKRRQADAIVNIALTIRKDKTKEGERRKDVLSIRLQGQKRGEPMFDLGLVSATGIKFGPTIFSDIAVSEKLLKELLQKSHFGFTNTKELKVETEEPGCRPSTGILYRFIDGVIYTVQPGSTADNAGILTGDKIVSVGGRSLETLRVRPRSQLEVGSKTKYVLERKGKQETYELEANFLCID